jgi:hypothetical protein
VPAGGTTGQVLQKSAATDYATAWAVTIGAPYLAQPQAIFAATGTVLASQYDNLINATAANVTLTLPAFSTAFAGIAYRFTRVDASTYTVQIAPAGTDTIDGANTAIRVPPNGSVTLTGCIAGANARQWVRIAERKKAAWS